MHAGPPGPIVLRRFGWANGGAAGMVLAATSPLRERPVVARTTNELTDEAMPKLKDRCRRPDGGGLYPAVGRNRTGFPGGSSIRYAERLAQAGVRPSVGSVGDSCDNALAESVIGLFETEMIERRGPWRSFGAVELATLASVDRFTTGRLLGPLGQIPPAEAEAIYHAQLEGLPVAT